MNKETELAVLEKQYEIMEAKQRAEFALTPVGQMLRQFETLQRMGQMYAQSTIVPDTYSAAGIFQNLLEKERKLGNQPDFGALQKQAQGIALANCSIALDMATRMKANPVMVMQNLYIVHGNPSWSSKFLIATINTCGRFMPLMYECNEGHGDEYGWRCYTYSSEDRERKNRLEGSWVTWKMVKAEGWDAKKGSKWGTMPEQMFKYRAAAFWQRMYAPEISMGFNTVEESQDIEDVDYEELSYSSGAEEKAESRRTITTLARAAAIKDATIKDGGAKEGSKPGVQRSVAEQTSDAAEYQRKKAEEIERRFSGVQPQTVEQSMFGKEGSDKEEGGES